MNPTNEVSLRYDPHPRRERSFHPALYNIEPEFWSGRRESNSRHQLGRLRSYHYTTPAYAKVSAGKPAFAKAASIISLAFQPKLRKEQGWWRGLDSNQRTLRDQIYSLAPLTTRPPLLIFVKSAIKNYAASNKKRSVKRATFLYSGYINRDYPIKFEAI